MTWQLSNPRQCTLDEYFQIDTDSGIRHEYINGRIVDLPMVTWRHSQLTTNVTGLIWTQLRGQPCEGRGGDLRIRYGRRVQYGYPDALIVCGQPQFDPAAPVETTLLNPRVLIEVLSESTEAYDRGLKFERYREIESFTEYLLIAADRPSIEVYRRQPSGFWMLQPYSGLEAVVTIESAGIELPLSEVYAGLTFPPEPDVEMTPAST